MRFHCNSVNSVKRKWIHVEKLKTLARLKSLHSIRDFQLPKPQNEEIQLYHILSVAFRGTRKIFKLQNKQLDFRKGSSCNAVAVAVVCQMPTAASASEQ